MYKQKNAQLKGFYSVLNLGISKLEEMFTYCHILVLFFYAGGWWSGSPMLAYDKYVPYECTFVPTFHL